jgi:hypothetical protein
MQNSKCYEFKKFEYHDGIFNDSVDATYILYLDGNGRLPDIEKQLSIYHPTNIVYIVCNKGFKQCKKELVKQNSMYDLIDAYYQACNHSKQNDYSNILILEDDFIFSPQVKDPKHIHNVNTFLNDNRSNEFIYNLGIVPFFTCPIDIYNHRVVGVGMHASIFSKVAQNKLIDNISSLNDLDVNVNTRFKRYMYYTPLCYQLFPDTENSKNWNDMGLTMSVLKVSNLHHAYEPGTSNMYIFAKMLSLLLFIMILCIIYIAFVYFKLPKAFAKWFYLKKR